MSKSAAAPIVVPCNICGSTEFVGGPGGRLSMTQRLPLCAKCGSLERHRAVRTVFDALPDDLFRGTLCLQFSPDPALDPRRFDEILVSVWGGQNSLDMQAIALPDASYDWVYSSHVINHIPNTNAAMREMLRVVGDGCLVLNVGGTMFQYTTANSQQFCGPDRQWKVYGTLYADELQQTLPEVAVLELIGFDPCSVTLDSVYFASIDDAKLARMAAAAQENGLHARLFPAPKPTTKRNQPRPLRGDAWDTLRGEIEAWRASGARAEFWVRDDDATEAHPLLIELVKLCGGEAVPLTLAVIPLPMGPDLIDLIDKHQELTPIQHGFDHRNHESGGQPKSEFGEARLEAEALRSLELGQHALKQAFGARALPVFCPPWGTMAPRFRDRLRELGFSGYSGSRIASEIHRRGTSPAGLDLASAHVAVNLTMRSGAPPLPETRILETLAQIIRQIRQDGQYEPVGIMTHHWGVDASVRRFLERLFDVTRKAGGTWTGPKVLFPRAYGDPVQGSTSTRPRDRSA